MHWMQKVLAIVLVSTMAAVSLAADESERLNRWLDEQYELELQRSPLTLAVHGRKEQYDKVDDFSVAAELDWLDWLAASAAAMQTQFDYAKLSPQARLSYDFWLFRARSEAASRPYLYHDYVFDQFGSTQTYPVRFLLNYHVVDTVADMEAYVARVRGFSRAIGQWLATTKKAADLGIRPPRFAYEVVLQQSRGVIAGKPFDDAETDSALWADGSAKIADLKQRGLTDDEQAARLRLSLQEALLNDLMPAYNDLIAWHSEDIGNARAQARGAASLPQGDAYYEERLRHYTHSDLSAEAIHKLGLDEVARIQREMQVIMRSLGYEGSLQSFFAFVRDDPRFYYPDTDAGREAYLARTRALLTKMDGMLPEYFGLLPRSSLVVKRVEAYRERDGAVQFYEVGTADGSRPGVYYVHLSDIGAYNKTDLETTAYHEGSPGHHMQLSIAKELTGVPRFRTNVTYSAYTEGWALYSEYLAREMGAFEDPYNDFGRLVAEIWRAIRLVVDTGLHAKGWTEEQAVQYMLDNSAIPEAAVRSEIRRYLVAPGQATSYKVGMLKIQSLRARAEAELGDDFDIRGFHDVVLGGGSLPLPILEQAVTDWVESVRQAR
ncbi:DUF885 domain-containing protein [Pseudohalioglobus sediminis]|nr:DUF885 domain-containing protein [Pseudohalioglobus sediminis]